MHELLQIRRLPGAAYFRLKSWLPRRSAGVGAPTLGGRELPLEVGTTLGGPIRVLCIGPHEWLVVLADRDAAGLPEQTVADLKTQGLVLVDFMGGLTVFEVRGPAARDLLSKGCGLDFHLRSFVVGQCARARLAQLPVVIECIEDPARFHLYVARSYLDYFHAWLTDATAEFEGVVT